MRSLATFAIVLFGLIGCGFSVRSSTWTPPALAQIVAGGEYLCAATIIDDYYVVTAASCVSSLDVNTTDVYVKVGTTKTGKTLPGSTAQSSRAIAITTDSSSSSSNRQSSTTDIAVIQVETAFTYSGSVMWASPTYQTISTSTSGVVATWSSLDTLNDQVVSAAVEAISSTACKTYITSVTVNSTQTCLLPTISTSKPCEADLGAPFYRNELLYGVVSYTPGCDDASNPVVVTNIGDAVAFIVETISGYVDTSI